MTCDSQRASALIPPPGALGSVVQRVLCWARSALPSAPDRHPGTRLASREPIIKARAVWGVRQPQSIWGARRRSSRGSRAEHMCSHLELGSFSVAMWTIGLGAIGAAVTGIILANTDLFLSKAEQASLDFLEAIDLKTLGEGNQRTFKAEELWKKNGAVIMAVRRPG
uniref:Peroxiredoxin-like 2 activated in M-CSF stimulated monocytes n=3 Tax=Anolis carolinensis TaxID=28377 RepID=A0A803TMN2_ANOCA